MGSRQMFHPVAITGDLLRPNTWDVTFDTSYNALYVLCKTFTLILPKSNSIAVQWMSGVMQLAGRANNPITFQVSFYTGQEPGNNDYDVLQQLYDWRQKCFDHKTGSIGLAKDYKKQCSILMKDTTYTNTLYSYTMDGVWPVSIEDINLDVASDEVLSVNATFAADIVYMGS